MTEHNDFMLKSNITTEPVTAGVYPLPTAGADGRIRVYFADKELLFTLEAAPEGYYAVSQYDLNIVIFEYISSICIQSHMQWLNINPIIL